MGSQMSERISCPTIPEDLREQIQNLESQLLALRRQLEVRSEPLPQEPFFVLEVRVEGSWYLFPVSPIVEVLSLVWPQRLPEAPSWVLGCIDVGGEVVPLIDLGQRLEKKRTSTLGLHQMMVLVDASTRSAFLVDELGDVDLLSPQGVTPPSKGIAQTPFLSGTISESGGRVKYLLSVERLSREFILEEQAEIPISGEAM